MKESEVKNVRRLDPGIAGEAMATIDEGIRGIVSSDIRQTGPSLLAGPELPPYATPLPEVPDIGRLSAAAVVRDFEETAKKFEAISAEIGEVARTCEAYMNELEEMRKQLDDHASAVRDRGKAIFEAIQATSKITQSTRTEAQKLIEGIISSPLSAR